MESEAQRIIDRILQDAKEEAESLVAKAQSSAEMLLEDRRQSSIQRAEKDKHPTLKRAESEAEVVRGKAIADAKIRAGWMVLSEKVRLVTSVLDEAKSRLEYLHKSEKYTAFLEKMIVNAGAVLHGGELEVMLNENDSSLALKINVLAEAIAEKTGVKTQLVLSDERIDALGVIVKTADGRIVVDNTFEAILKRREKELRLKIAKMLFK